MSRVEWLRDPLNEDVKKSVADWLKVMRKGCQNVSVCILKKLVK